MFTVFTRRDHMNALLLSYSQHLKLNLSESLELTSYDMLADVFRNSGACIDPGPKCRQVVNLDIICHLYRLVSCSLMWRLNIK